MNAAQAKLTVGLLQSANDELTAERDRLRASNAGLLKALKDIARSDEFNGGTYVKELQDIARSAIAKAKS